MADAFVYDLIFGGNLGEIVFISRGIRVLAPKIMVIKYILEHDLRYEHA